MGTTLASNGATQLTRSKLDTSEVSGQRKGVRVKLSAELEERLRCRGGGEGGGGGITDDIKGVLVERGEKS